MCRLTSWSHPQRLAHPSTFPSLSPFLFFPSPLSHKHHTDREAAKDKFYDRVFSVWPFKNLPDLNCSKRRVVILRKLHSIKYLRSHTPHREKHTEELKNVCVPVPRSDCLIICRWAAEGLQSVEVPPGTQRIWLNLWLPYSLQDPLSFDFKRLFILYYHTARTV